MVVISNVVVVAVVVAGSVTPPVTVAMVGTMDPAAIVDAPWIAS